MIYNMHERVINGTPDEVWAVLCDVERIYPEKGKFRLPEGVHVGAPVRHDGARYVIKDAEPGRKLWFDLGKAMSEGHGFTLTPVEGGTLVRHEIKGRPGGMFRILWPLMVRRAHDRVMEQLLVNLELEVARAHAG